MKWWQTTRSWVETATAKTEIANTMVKFHQQHGLLFIFTKWPLLKFGLGTYVRVFNKSQWPAKFAGYFTQTRRLLFFGNYPSLNRVFMCCQRIKKPKLHVCVLFKHSHFCFRILEMHPRGPDVKVFPESCTFIASLSFPTDSKAFATYLKSYWKPCLTYSPPYPPPPRKRASLFFSNTSISTYRNSWDTPITYFCLPRPRSWELVFWMYLL